MTKVDFKPMAGFRTINVGSYGPEDVFVLQDGALICGNDAGDLLRIEAELETVSVVAHVGGRALGLDQLPDGRVVACNPELGLQAVDLQTGAVEVLVDFIDGEPLTFCNNPAVAADGTIYFSSSTTRQGVSESTKDIMEGQRTGRLFRRLPDGTVETLLTDILFANGVALSPDEGFVVLNSTGEYAMHRFWLKGPRAGQHDMFAEDLPGFPDNLSVGTDGLLWCALVTPVTAALKAIERLPLWLRFVLAKLPEPPSAKPAKAAFCLAFNWDGTVAHAFADYSGRFNFTTAAREYEGRVYLGSLHGECLACFDL